MKATRYDSAAESWFRSLNCDARYGAALAGLLGGMLLLNLAGDPVRELLCYERAALARFEWWRLLSAHLVHLGWMHVLLNCGGLLLLWMLYARELTPARWLWIAGLSALAIDVGLWFREPDVEAYLGASGVLHGIWAAGACAAYRRGDAMGAAMLLLLVVKLIYEQQSGASVFEHDLPMVPAAHLFGALGGIIAAVLPRSAAKPL
ncbi:MAG TPA: rhombosortase [Steroidobacteraceae bacterium]|jgi:rhomboid family GlyGly-CTERM serine protease|nr:rhombosortase [Steroidobacteraceae bacterium]